MKIFLIGMPGSGKSTLGRKLAGSLLVEFVDLDEAIEQRSGRSIQQLFTEKGEAHFRLLESQLLLEWCASSKSFVMATGGGAPCFYDGMEAINQSGLSIFLHVPVPTLLSRLAVRTDRPLLDSADLAEKEAKLYALESSRLGCYKQARITLENANLDSLLQSVHLKGKS